MHKRARFPSLLLPLAVLSLTGCNQLGLRTGPAPMLDVSAVKTASSNQTKIIDALAFDASDNGVYSDAASHYYRIAEAGFNFVDDQCQSYFDQIFFIDRGRSQIKSGLAAAGATTAAILGVTNASTLSMSIVASAFGFASNATDIIAGTYLYSLPPATTQGLVTKLQAAYRDQAFQFRAEINTPTAAYHHIQNYLALCLPPRIEAEVINTVNAASVKVVEGNSGSTFSVRSVGPATTPTPQITKVVATNPVPVPTPPPQVRGALNPLELRLGLGFVTKAQNTLCVPASGVWDGPTREAIQTFFAGFDGPSHADDHDYLQTKGITQHDAEILQRAATAVKQIGKKCTNLEGDDLNNWRKDLGSRM